jgi:hypothetical protein
MTTVRRRQGNKKDRAELLELRIPKRQFVGWVWCPCSCVTRSSCHRTEVHTHNTNRTVVENNPKEVKKEGKRM